MVKYFVLGLLSIAFFVLGSFSTRMYCRGTPIVIEERYKEMYSIARLYIDTTKNLSTENWWCENIIEENDTTKFFFNLNDNFDVVYVHFGIFESSLTTPVFPLEVDFYKGSLLKSNE